ncbi:hypothetical protein K9N50_00075 [bacterium]|nr:hypothetical protein [bacterium]
MSLKREECEVGSLVELAKEELLKIIEESGAVNDGHYKLVSGNHSNRFFDINRIANNPKLIGRLSTEFIFWTRKNIDINIDVVLSPVTGGRILAFDLVREFNGSMETRLAHAPVDFETKPGCVLPELTPPSRIYEGENVLIVTDLSSTGSGLRSLETIVNDKKANLLGIVAVATRSPEAQNTLMEIAQKNNVKSHWLIHFNWKHWPPGKGSCYLCDQNIPLVEPAGGLSNFSPIIFGLKTSAA